MKRWLAPEIVQSSAMDCGPASLKCLLDGLGIPVSYGRLREACQTDVDGTSIDTMEDLAVQLGLDAEQVMVPTDHVLLSENDLLPAIVVTTMPDGLTHFVVVWSTHGPFVQVMDPASGRTWMTKARLAGQLYVHEMAVPAAAWREHAGGVEFTGCLRRRARDAGIPPADFERRLARALEDPSWVSLAALDAALRMVAGVVRAGGLDPHAASAVIDELATAARDQGDGASPIPPALWSVRRAEPDADGDPQLRLRGAVAVRVRPRQEGVTPAGAELLPPDLAAALREPPPRPARELFSMLRQDGVLSSGVVLGGLGLGAFGVLIEALLFNGLLDVGQRLGVHTQRIGAWGALVLFALGMMLLELPIERQLLRLGRHLELRLRLAFLSKIPKLGDRYFRSRLSSDMAERGHSLYALRSLPHVASSLLRSTFALLATALGIAWLAPEALPLALVAAVVSIGIPLLAQASLAGRDLRVRTHLGALSRFYYDGLLGLIAIRSHNAERAVRREHEGLLAEWERASLGLQRSAVGFETLSLLAGFGLAAAVVFSHAAHTREVGGVLLLVYWALNLPALGQEIGASLRQYPAYRNLALRLFEPLGAPEEPEARDDDDARALLASEDGVSLAFDGVAVKAGGHALLTDLSFRVAPGEQVAIVGESGAGKSTLVGLLLGWHRAAVGELLVDGAALTPARLDALRQVTAWVDPGVHLWNRTLLENLRYGNEDDELELGALLEAADLRGVVRNLSDGLQTVLGEGGALVSGGEGQRVRLGRALAKRRVRLVVLDEFARGLDHTARRRMLATARKAWPKATVLCISHDVEDMLEFDRVLVVAEGRVAEDAAPRELAADPGSRFAELLRADRAVRSAGFGNIAWRRLRVEGGKVEEQGA
ncbi:MAG: ATP-binding cassette domain-containing protein [Polyangiaceae bacterium]|nr:ATP-binding cassette domain-containing protein [Polyangiaceae bacterium]